MNNEGETMRGATTKKEELMPTQGWGGKMN
jgi:hypothetical protein